MRIMKKEFEVRLRKVAKDQPVTSLEWLTLSLHVALQSQMHQQPLWP